MRVEIRNDSVFIDCSRIDLFEVSILDNRNNPAYAGTSIEMREDKEIISECRSCDMRARVIDESMQ